MGMEYGGSVLFNGGSLMRKLCLTLAVFFLTITNVLSADFLYHSDGPYKGKVIDLETGEPIEGAVVAGVWILEFNLTPFCDAKETMTDKNGEFILPKASCFTLWPLTQMGRLDIIVFKPGYLGFPPLGYTSEERKARMPDFTGDEFKDKKKYYIIKLGKPKTREERELTYDHAGLFTFDEAFKKLPTLLRLTNEERRNLGLPGEEGK
jgi:hypothetical protein